MLDTISAQAHKLIDLTKNHKKNSTKTKLLTITSGKGGVGKSTFCANIAFLFAKRGYKIGILDADIGLANMQVLFNVRPKVTMFDYIEGKVPLKDAVTDTAYSNISIIAGKSGYEFSGHSGSFVFTRIVTDILREELFDILIVDTGAGLNSYVKEFLQISDNILALTTTDPSALTDVYALMKMLSNDKKELMLCFNHTKNYEIGRKITDSLVDLAKKNRLNANFMVKYIGNVSSSANISTTGRLRKLFAKEFATEFVTQELDMIVCSLIDNI